jgi:hypothetical protein
VRRFILVVLFISTFTGACASEAPGPDRATCERLRDHLVDLRLFQLTADREAHRENLRRELGEQPISACLEATRDEVDCQLRAASLDALGGCATR